MSQIYTKVTTRAVSVLVPKSSVLRERERIQNYVFYHFLDMLRPRSISQDRILSDGMKIRLLMTTRSDQISSVIFRLFEVFFVGLQSSDSVDSDRISFVRNCRLRLIETVVSDMNR
jgi:hypothetical protein